MGAKAIKPFSAEETVALSNEWMRRYTEEPDAFQASFKTAMLFLAEQQAGKTPSYGEQCVAYLQLLREELAARERGIEVIVPLRRGRRKAA